MIGSMADEGELLRAEVESLKELLADATPRVVECLRLRAENRKLANWLMHPYVFVHERIIEDVDKALETYLGTSDDASLEPSPTA